MKNASDVAPENGPTLQRGLKNRHIQLIALGGAIGTGLFLGIGPAIQMAGPAVLLAYLKAVDVRRPPEKEISPPPKSEKTPERQEGFFDGIPGVPVDEIFGKEERS